MDEIGGIIGKNIKRLRQREDLTGIELAKALKVSQSTVSQWENGVKVPRARMTERIAGLFNVEVATILSDGDKDLIDLEKLFKGDARLVVGSNVLNTDQKKLLLKIIKAVIE